MGRDLHRATNLRRRAYPSRRAGRPRATKGRRCVARSRALLRRRRSRSSPSSLTGAVAASGAARPRGAGLERPAAGPGGRRRVHEELDRPDRALRRADPPQRQRHRRRPSRRPSSARRLGSAPGERAVRLERPRKGVTITRDRWGVPHVKGTTAEDVAFGAGWATAADRQLIMELLRGPGRIAALDAPGVNAFSLALSGQDVPSERRDGGSARAAVRPPSRAGREGPAGDPDHRRVRRRDQRRSTHRRASRSARWTRADVVAIGGLIGAVFGAGGGDEVRRSEFLAKLQASSAPRSVGGSGRTSASATIPRRDVAVPGKVPYGSRLERDRERRGRRAAARRRARPTATTSLPACRTRCSSGRSARRPASRSSSRARRSGTTTPRSCWSSTSTAAATTRAAPRSPGSRSRSCSAAGPTTRGARPRQGPTSSTSTSRRSAAEATRSTSSAASAARWTLRRRHDRGRPGEPDQQLVFRETVHGPVIGYATVEGKRVAISRQALDARPRAASRAVLPRPLDATASAPRRSSPSRLDDGDVVQLALRRQPRHRAVHERPAAGAPADGRPGPAHEGHRRVRVAGLPPPAAARPADQSDERRDPQLEQQAGARLRARQTTSGRGARSSASICSGRGISERQKHTLATWSAR